MGSARHPAYNQGVGSARHPTYSQGVGTGQCQAPRLQPRGGQCQAPHLQPGGGQCQAPHLQPGIEHCQAPRLHPGGGQCQAPRLQPGGGQCQAPRLQPCRCRGGGGNQYIMSQDFRSPLILKFAVSKFKQKLISVLLFFLQIPKPNLIFFGFFKVNYCMLRFFTTYRLFNNELGVVV